MRGLALLVLLPLLLLCASSPALAAPEHVDLELVLAADVSRSIDEEEFALQRQGYAAAFTDPRVLAAIRSGPSGAIAVCFVEWSGLGAQKIVADWTVIRDGETGAVFAQAVRTAPRAFAGFTSISAAIDFAMAQFARSGVTAGRRIIDVSGDGTNNGGRSVFEARDDAVHDGVTINGLAIVNLHPHPGFTAHTQPRGGIGHYYETNVTGGPGSFVIVIKDFRSFADAIVQKLVNEIAALEPPGERRLAAR